MGRLIDADAFIEYVNRRYDLCSDELRMMIEEQPTAYDVEKVVEELEEMNMDYFLTIANTGSEKLDIAYGYTSGVIKKAIEIVRKGGVDG